MPKRQNPYGDSSPLQIKTHIGPKEVDMGVNKEKNMTNVYERTKSLLYEGAKKMSPVNVSPKDDRTNLRPLAGQCRLTFKSNSESDCNGHCAMEVGLERLPECAPNSSGLDKPQPDHNDNCAEDLMTMDCDTNEPAVTLLKGQLQIDSSGQLQKATVQLQCNAISTPYKLCNSCLRPSPLSMDNCQFCDKRTCCNCIRECHSCHGSFCQVCSVINYDACTERPFCLQCST